MGTLDEYGFTEFSSDESIQGAFLTSVHDASNTFLLTLIPGTDLILDIPFPDVAPSGFFPSNMSVSEHREKHENYHDKIFPLMESVAKGLNLEPVGPVAPPIMDPTLPLLKIYNLLKDILPDFDLFIQIPDVFEWIISKAAELLEKFNLLLTGQWEPLFNFMITMPDFSLRFDIEEFEIKISELPDLIIPFPELPFSLPPPLPVPPFIDIPPIMLPTLTMPGFGIIDLFVKIINAIMKAVSEVLALLTSSLEKLLELIEALSNGIVALISYLFNLIVEFVIEPILSVIAGLKTRLGFIATLGVIIKYAIGMGIISIVTFILGPGAVSLAIAQLLGLV